MNKDLIYPTSMETDACPCPFKHSKSKLLDIQRFNFQTRKYYAALNLIPNFCAIKTFNHLWVIMKQIVHSQIEHLWNCLVCFNLDFLTLFSFEPYKINLFVLVWFRQLNHIGYCSKIVREGGFFNKMFYFHLILFP